MRSKSAQLGLLISLQSLQLLPPCFALVLPGHWYGRVSSAAGYKGPQSQMAPTTEHQWTEYQASYYTDLTD